MKENGTHESKGRPSRVSGENYTSIARQANGTFSERGIDADTLEIRAVEVTSNHAGDAPMLPELLSQVPDDQEIGLVTADGAYDTRACHNAIASLSLIAMQSTAGQRMAREFNRQVTELQVRAAVLNRLTVLGIPQTYPVG